MADLHKEHNFEPGAEAVTGSERSPEKAGVEMSEDTAERPLTEEERAGEIFKKLNEGPREINKEELEVKELDIEQRKVRIVNGLVAQLIAAKDNPGLAEQILEKARKRYIIKYPGIVDEIHDVWLEERNNGM